MNILIAGDFVSQHRLESLIDRGDYESVFGMVKPVVKKMDYAIVNLECPVVRNEGSRISKIGPHLHCTEKSILALKWAGFSCCTLANNHILDYGEEGMKATIKACKAQNMDVVGVGENLGVADNILYKELNGETLAVINCCEHEFSVATEQSGGANPLNPIKQYYSIKEARTKADFVLVIVHGGHELYQLPSQRMVDTYRFFIDAGADAVINHHQHCYSGYELYRGKPVFYGLGNFCFDKNPPKINEVWNYGFMVNLSLLGEKVEFELFPYEQCGEYVGVKMLPKNSFDTELSELNALITDEQSLAEATKTYYISSSNHYGSIFEPLNGRVFSYFRSLKLLPSLISKKRLLKAKDYIKCEAHRDKLVWWLDNYCPKDR